MAAGALHDSAHPFRVRRVEAWALRVKVGRPVETAFGAMRDRPAVFVRVEDAAGAFGFGEIWCNFPGCGAEHRVRLATEELGELLCAPVFRSPAHAHETLTEAVRIRVLQTGEAGPYRQALAGIDIALWDLAARVAGKPLRRYLAAAAADRVPAYASGIHVGDAAEAIGRARDGGFRAFKVKVGFDAAADLKILERLVRDLRPGEQLFADANQAWDLRGALAFAQAARDFRLGWLEEPLPADAPAADWRRLAADGNIPLAGGENIAGDAAFLVAVAAGALTFIQPDIAKWGGFSGCLPVARAILDGGRTYCPHFLGGGIGLAASAHLLAAIGGPGLLELDANPNPLREAFPQARQTGGEVVLSDVVGLGIEAIPKDLLNRVTLYRQWPA
jgi:L-alanine-DL-glutamate epimerase-like enolase superfamily enzyme